MKRGTRWALTAVVSLIAVVGLLVIPALGDSVVTSEVGLLRLQLSSKGDKVVYDPVAPGNNLIQSLNSKNCKLERKGAALLDFTASSANAGKKPFPGLKDHRIGVGQNGEGSGSPCARIDVWSRFARE
jgi:hypothetical protein